MDRSNRKQRQSRVPTTRLGRLLRLGVTAGGMAASGAAGALGRLTGQSTEKAVNAFLSATNAERLARRLAGLRGAAMKLGQLLSMESADVLPAEFTEALAILRDAADTMPVSQIRRVLGREYGRGWQARFAEFDYQPIASASIGQVHCARTTDGRNVALKIQYPGVARSINSDVDNLASLLRLARVLPIELDISELVDEAKRQLRQEADYTFEADYADRYRALVADERRLTVPRIHRDLSTRRVLAMDYEPGEPLESLGISGTRQALRDEIGTLLQRLMFRELFEFRVMQSDPNFANYLFQPRSNRVVLLDFGATVTFSSEFAWRYAAITRAIIAGDLDRVREQALAIGYLHPEDSSRHSRQVIELLLLVCEPLRHHGPYDFAASDLVSRARDHGFDLVFRSGEFRAPPTATAFLHRKLIGSFLLCARIHARVDMNRMIAPFLERFG